MTKPEYLEWLRTRGESGTRDLAKCRAADTLIESVAMTNLGDILQRIDHPAISDYVKLMASIHYGSSETDEFLTRIKAYPDWING